MRYTMDYDSPVGKIMLTSDGEGLTGLWFYGQKYFAAGPGEESVRHDAPVFSEAARWLDIYFSGKNPEFTPALHMKGTEFQRAVWKLLMKIPYGETMTYGGIAAMLPSGGSARAVGSAVARNAISIIVPCHRVVGADGSLTGYSGGLEKKLRLLRLEGADVGQNAKF